MHPKANKLVHLAKALAITRNWIGAEDYCRENLAVYRELPGACKAAISATSLEDLRANVDYAGVSDSFIESLRGKSIFDTVTEFATRLTLGQPFLAAAMPVVGGVVLPRPVSKLDLSRNPLEAKNAGVVVAISKDALGYSSGTRLLARELTGGVVSATDNSFLSGLLAEVGSNTETSGSGGIGADLKVLLDIVSITGGENLFLVIPPAVANSLSSQQDGEKFPDLGPSGGSVCGVRTLVSGQLPPADSSGSTVLLLDAASLAFASGPIGLSVSDAGYIDLSDDPEGSNVVSLFQSDCVAIAATRLFGWKTIRTNAVAAMVGVNW